MLMEKWTGHNNMFSSTFTPPVETSFESARNVYKVHKLSDLNENGTGIPFL